MRISLDSYLHMVMLLLAVTVAPADQGVQESALSAPAASVLQGLPLDAAKRSALQDALGKHNYGTAEDLLAAEAKANPKSQKLLLVLAQVLFLDGKQLNAALVLKKAELLGTLDEQDRFLLALSYVAIGRKKLATGEFEELQKLNPANAVYPYWLSRLTYRQMNLQSALGYAQTAVRLNPTFMKAYDQLGLCYVGLNQTEEAIQAYTQAVRLNRQQSSHWPWPSMNLGTLLLRLDRLDEAESELRDSVSIDARFPTAHLRLGQVLEKKQRYDEAVAELNEAAQLDPTYPDPHYALARIYRKRQSREDAEKELAIFQELRNTDKAKGITRPD